MLSSYPLQVAIDEGLADADGNADSTTSRCRAATAGARTAAFYTYLQGTSMASPHVAGLAALVIEAHGRGSHAPRLLARPRHRAARSSSSPPTDHACPAGGVEDYTDEGRPADWNAACEGTTADNGLYGEGIVNAAAAAGRR